MSHDLLYPKKGYSVRERPLAASVIGLLAFTQLISATAVLLVREPTVAWSAASFAELINEPALHRFRAVTEIDEERKGKRELSIQTGAVDRERDLTLERISAPWFDEGMGDIVDPRESMNGEGNAARRFRMTTIKRGLDVYIKVPATESPEGVGGSKSWIRYDYGSLLPDVEDIVSRIDVSQVYKNVRAGGYSTIRGLRVRSISAEIDCTPYFRVVAEAMAKKTGEPVAETSAGQGSLPRVSAKAFISDAGELVRLVATATVAEGQKLQRVRTTHDIFDAGKPVRIELPDERETLTISLDNLGRGESGSTFQTAAAGATSVSAPGAMSGVLNMMM